MCEAVAPLDVLDLPDGRTRQARQDMGQRLKALRMALGMTQLRLASAMGVSCPTVSAWESGRNPIDIVTLAQAARQFGFTTDYVALGDLSGIEPGLAGRLLDCASVLPSRGRRGRPRLEAAD
jgi:transcriptional regulator with XRE-family HTH domain